MKIKKSFKNIEPVSGGSFLKKTSVIAVLLTTLITSVSAYYLHFSWHRYQDSLASEAIMLAQSIGSMLHPEHVLKLSGDSSDLSKSEYLMIKENLSDLAEGSEPIWFAYIMAERGEDIIFLVDSESADSPDHSPPGQIYGEAADEYRMPFLTGETVLTEPSTDRWGTWISALVPVIDPVDEKVIAVLGIDYSASLWKLRIWRRMIPDFMIVVCIILLYLAFISIWAQHSKLKYFSKRLAYDEALYHSVFDQAPIGIAIVNDKSFAVDSEFGDININSMFETILDRDHQSISKLKWPDITHPDDLSEDLAKFERFKAGETDGYTMEKRFIKPDGSSVWTNMKISSLNGGAYEDSLHLCLLEDISGRKSMEASLEESERSKSVLLSHLPGMAYRCDNDREWTMRYVSEGCLDLTGYFPESILNNKEFSYNDLIEPEYRDLIWQEWRVVLQQRLPFKFEYEIRTAKGERKWVLEMGEGIYNDKDEVEALEGIVIDISERKEMENKLRYDNEHDKWTGLYNRYYLEEILRNETDNKDNSRRALVGINLSTVQTVAAVYGLQYTQDLIRKAGEELNNFSSPDRMLFNDYSDRFVFYIKGYSGKDILFEFCRTISDSMESALADERIGGGIGVVEIDPDDNAGTDQLLKQLLIASEKAISISEKDFDICFYDQDMEEQILREEEIKRELARVVSDRNDGGLFLQFQPIVDLKTSEICGFEALARLNSDKFGSIPSMEFISVAEKTKLIIPVGEKIIINALKFLNKIKSAGYDDTNVSINISAMQLLKSDFAAKLIEAITGSHADPNKIHLEITESILASDFDEINRIIAEVRDIGIKVCIDDFGTGYSSLAKVRELNVDCLKIDRYFIDKLMSINADNAITSDIISIAHKLGHYTVAEGVENELQRQFLQEHGCDKIQGFLISRPLDEDAAIDMLIKSDLS